MPISRRRPMPDGRGTHPMLNLSPPRPAHLHWPRRWCYGVVCAVLALLHATPAIRADDEPPVEDIFRSNTDQVVQGAATLAGAGCQGGHGTAMVLGLLMRGDRQHLWKLEASDR